MLSPRGWWFLVPTLTMLSLTVLLEHAGLTLVLLTLVLWFFGEMVVFSVRARVVARGLRCEYQLRDLSGPVNTLWAGQSFEVHVTVRLDGRGTLPYAVVADRVPFGLKVLHGETEYETGLSAGEPLRFVYQARTDAPGELRFLGVGVRCGDWQGLFTHQLMVSTPVIYRVLPPLVDADGQPTTMKRHNLLPPPGTHRFQRPGSGSELLDLRDYMTGDPPKTIAWKVSARRDRLITKEFESEAPLRCTMFLDASNAVRLGPPGHNALARLVSVTAAVAQLAASARDLVGLSLVTEDRCLPALSPGRNRRHLIDLLRTLADAAALAPATAAASPLQLIPAAYALARDVYPELLNQDVNQMPFWLPWRSAQPAFTQSERTRDDQDALAPWFYFARFERRLRAMLLSDAMQGNSIGWFMSPRRRRLMFWRKQLAAVLSQRYGMMPGGLSRLMEDDIAFVTAAQRFLSEHRVPYPLPLYDSAGRYLFASASKVSVLATALLRSVARARDNELFVLLVDLLELTDGLDPLLRAVRVAQSRHHRVLVVSPWPPGVQPPPAVEPGDLDGPLSVGGVPGVPSPAAGPNRPDGPRPARAADPYWIMERSTVARLHRAFWTLRHALAKLGVTVLCVEDDDTPRRILKQLERLRMQGPQGRFGRPGRTS